MNALKFTQADFVGRLIGIKRKPREVSQIPNGTSLNSDIIHNFEGELWKNQKVKENLQKEC